MPSTLDFKPKIITKRLISVLPERSRDIITNRYGLVSADMQTLEAIGSGYNITRERVRQIENHAISLIKKSDTYKEVAASLASLEEYLHDFGVIVPEEDFLNSISSESVTKNNILFLLTLGDSFINAREDDHLTHRWHVNKEVADVVEKGLRELHNDLEDEAALTEEDMVTYFLEYLKDLQTKYKSRDLARKWLNLSKKISSNPLNEWGKIDSPHIGVKGVRDFAYLVVRHHGSPLHFSDIAKQIQKMFGRKAHTATTHNELIRDKRFVLVGRGLYALNEWGYTSGVVRDVIENILKNSGPLTKEEVIDKVLKERYVKTNTILVNLQNQKFFKKNKDGKYILV